MTKSQKWLVAGSALTVALAVGAKANASGGLALDQFQPAPAGDRFFGVQGGDPGGDLLPRLMLLGDYAYKPYVLRLTSDDSEAGALVKHQLFAHVAAGITLWDRLSVFANMPLALVNTGDTVGGTKVESGVAAGDLRLGARVRLVGESRSIATLSLSGYVYVPTGKKDRLTGADEVHGMPALVLSGENDMLAYAVNAGVDLRKRTDVPGIDAAAFGSQLTFGAACGVLLADQTVQLGPEIYGSSLLVGSEKFTKHTTNLEAILGVRARLGDIVLGAGAGPGITQAVGTPTLRGVASVAYAPLPPKPAPRVEPLPPPPPPPPPPPDRDKDGVYDKDDACPDVAGVRSSDPAKNGCPPPPPDRDGDGIVDKDDACPELSGVASSDPTQNGCPPDTDGDGLRDDVDACPREKGKPSADPQKNGCPALVRVTDEEIVILEQVQFKTGSATILKASDDLLTQVATVLSEHPEIVRLEVQGHTDNRGSKKANKKLSEKRAASVVKWLVKTGHIDAARLTSHGYGSEEPIAENDTPDGRQKNRRVQFKVVEKSGAGKP